MRFVILRLTLVGAIGGAVACEPKVKESHRHLAEDYCRERVEYWSRCNGSGNLWPDDLKQEEFDECVADEAWDWTDECGDIAWELRQCQAEVPCERWPAVARDEDNSFCQEEELARYGGDCLYTEDHGG